MLTPKLIAAAIKAGRDTVLTDSTGEKGVGSLRLVIRGGSASWAGWWIAGGKQQKLTLGRHPDMSLHEARAAFDERVRQPLVAGRNPRTIASRHTKPTVAALFQAYADDLKAQGKVSCSVVDLLLVSGSTNCASLIGREKLAADVTPGDVVAAAGKWFDRGCRRQADYARSAMSAAFNFGLRSANSYLQRDRMDWGLKMNPAAAVEKDSNASQPRTRNLSVDEIRQLWAGLAGLGFYADTADAIRLVLLCGQRVRETLRAEGADFDLDAMVWRMPPHKTKGGKAHALPLPALAVPVVRGLIARHGRGWLFPARLGAKGPLMMDTTLNMALRRWAETAGLERFQPRDLRRTWKSRAGEAGVDRFTRDLIQQHAKSDTGSRFYDQSDYLPQMRAAMDKWNGWLVAALEHPPCPLADGGAIDAQPQPQVAA